MNKILIFDLYGNYAHFKDPRTNMSPITYDFPSRTVLCGILSSIMGIERKNRSLFNDSFIAISIKNDINKLTLRINNIKTNNMNINDLRWCKVKPTLYEFLYNPCYRIYFYYPNENIFNELVNRIRNKQSQYHIFLGQVNCLANFNFIALSEYHEIKTNQVEMSCVIRSNELDGKIKRKDNCFVREIRMPRLVGDKDIYEWDSFTYSNGSLVVSLKNEYYYIEETGENICGI